MNTMNKVVLLLVLVFSAAALRSQEEGELILLPDLYEGDSKLSVRGGLLSIGDRVKTSSGTETEGNLGYYLGIAYNFNFSPNFDIQTELNWANSRDGRDAFLFPVLADIALTEDLSFQAGPQFAFLLQEQPPNLRGYLFQLALGARYELGSSVYADLRYARQLSNSFTGEGDFTIGFNYLTLGIGLTLN